MRGLASSTCRDTGNSLEFVVCFTNLFTFRKPRKDKRKAEKFTGAQGTDQGKSETYDYSNRVTGAKEAAAKV